MLETVTITEYAITITTRSRAEAERILKDIPSAEITNSSIELCAICRQEIIYGYTSFGTVELCDNCKLNNLDSFPQCSRCGKNPKEPISSEGYCYPCYLETITDINLDQ